MHAREDILELLKGAARQKGWYAEHRKYAHEDVLAAQKALGVDADGVIGSETHDAVRAFQQLEGAAEIDGLLGPETFGLLASAYAEGRIPLSREALASLADERRHAELRAEAAYKEWLPILYNRARKYPKSTVRDIQRVVGVDTDGAFGPDTVRRIRDWQIARGLPADGKVGPETLKAMGLCE